MEKSVCEWYIVLSANVTKAPGHGTSSELQGWR